MRLTGDVVHVEEKHYNSFDLKVSRKEKTLEPTRRWELNIDILQIKKGSGYLSRYSAGLRAGRPGYDFRVQDFLFSIASRSTLGTTQFPVS
jgi:hypothetical protein